MKKITAVIREEAAQTILDLLAQIGMQNATVSEVTAVGPQANDPDSSKLDITLGRLSKKMLKLEFFTPEEYLQRVVAIVLSGADTNRAGDGVLSVTEVTDLYRINKRQKLT